MRQVPFLENWFADETMTRKFVACSLGKVDGEVPISVSKLR